jgi:hypothetical protein
VHLLERQCRIALDHALRRHSLAEEIDKRIQRNPSASDPICAVDLLRIPSASPTLQIHGHTPNPLSTSGAIELH